MGDAQFVIDIASSYSGERTNAELDALTSKLISAGVNADTFQNAIVNLSRAQTAAATASVAANAALVSGNQEYAQLERAADKASRAQEKAARLGVVPPTVAASVQATTAALSAHTAALAKLERAAKAAAADETALSNAIANTRKLATETAKAGEAAGLTDGKIKKLKGALPALGGVLGSVGGQAAAFAGNFEDLTAAFGSSGGTAIVAAGAMSAVAVAALAVTAAVVAGTIAVASWAIGLADTARNADLTAQALGVLNPRVIKLRAGYADLGAETGFANAQLDEIAKGLIAAHIAAKDLPGALRAAALSEAALGQGGAQEFQAQMLASGKSVSSFSVKVSSQLGGIVAKKLMSVGAQTAQLHDNFAHLFGGLNIDSALTGLQKLVGLFDETTASGSAIKFIFEKIFQPIIDSADMAATAIEAFVLGLEIGSVKAYIAAKPLIKSIGELFGNSDTSTADTMAKITKAAEYLVPVILVGVGIFVAFAAAVAALIVLGVAVQVVLYATIAAIVAAGVAIVSGFMTAWDVVKKFMNNLLPSFPTLGTNIMQGLANGIASAAGLPLAAIISAVGGAITGAKHLLGIHSPSKVFAEIGGYTAEGFAQGVDDGAPDAQEAVSQLVKPPAAGTPAPKASGGSSKGAVDFTGAVFNFTGVKDAEHAADMVTEALTRLLEGDASQAYGGAPA